MGVMNNKKLLSLIEWATPDGICRACTSISSNHLDGCPVAGAGEELTALVADRNQGFLLFVEMLAVVDSMYDAVMKIIKGEPDPEALAPALAAIDRAKALMKEGSA